MKKLWQGFNSWLWGRFIGPLNKRRFAVRISLRVQWLFFRAWLKPLPGIFGLRKIIRRPVWLFIGGLGIPLFGIFLVQNGSLPGFEGLEDLGWPTGKPEWRALAQPLLLFVAAPAAFILWAFRDFNAQANLENQRKDVNLKEFQEIQMRAAGAMDENLPAKARETLQIAAIHQLRPFLRGEYGESFRRPAWELLRARLETSAEESGFKEITDWIDEHLGPFKVRTDGLSADEIKEKIRDILKKSKPGPVTLAERDMIKEEADKLFRSKFPLTNSRFGGINLSGGLLARLDLSGSSFVDAMLYRAHLEGANLMYAHLEGAYLFRAHLEGANLRFAHLEGANLSFAHLDEHTQLEGAQCDNSTRFADDWVTLSKAEKDEARAPWLERGMINIDAPQNKAKNESGDEDEDTGDEGKPAPAS